jgi:NAD(P)H dehydrogenase (quinone)
MILITGAGGKTGKALIKRISKAESVCAFVHRQEQAASSKALGAVETVSGDMHDRALVRSAMKNVRAVYHVCPNMNPDEQGIALLILEEAREAGVEHFIYHSVLHPQTETMKHHWQKLRVEEMIFESGLPFTILQPGPYMQNLLADWEGIVADGVLRVPYSVDSKLSFIDLEDLAEVGRIVLTEPNHRNATYELAGTPPMSHAEVAQIFGQVLNRDVRAEKEEIESWRVRANQDGKMSEYSVENLIRMFEYYDNWGLSGNPNVLAWILKRQPNSLESFIRRTWQERNASH